MYCYICFDIFVCICPSSFHFFLKKSSFFRDRDFYFFGESWAGLYYRCCIFRALFLLLLLLLLLFMFLFIVCKYTGAYVPMLSALVANDSQINGNFKGFGIGNPVIMCVSICICICICNICNICIIVWIFQPCCSRCW